MKDPPFFPLFFFLLLNLPSLSASNISDQAKEDISYIQKILQPHIPYYTKHTLCKDLTIPAKQEEAARFLYTEVLYDKDYLAAEALLVLQKLNSSIAAIFNGEVASKNIQYALTLKNALDKERPAIDSSISEALQVMASSRCPQIKKTSRWLEKPLPVNRIKCCAVELLAVHSFPEEISKILNILSQTQFGKEQVKKAHSKKKSSYS